MFADLACFDRFCAYVEGAIPNKFFMNIRPMRAADPVAAVAIAEIDALVGDQNGTLA